jgi:hypothetical protein
MRSTSCTSKVSSLSGITSLHLLPIMSRDILDVDVDKEIETGMNLAALAHQTSLCLHEQGRVKKEGDGVL